MTRICRLAQFVLIFSILNACSPSYSRFLSSYRPGLPEGFPDYGKLEYWAAHPDKADPSDSIPDPIRPDYHLDTSIDVFYIHPTTFTMPSDEGWNASFSDAELNAKTDYRPVLYQASAFNEYRVFAPRYRQAHIRSYFTKDTSRALQAFDLAYEDIKQAFLYYLVHNNHGHPIIIASHSQGSTHALRLLKEFFEEGTLHDKLVAAYIAGMYIPDSWFKKLSPCRDSLATGCFCGWRTFKKGYEPGFVKKEKGSGIVTNPITWTTGHEIAPPSLNKGAVLRNFNTIYPNVAGAQINDGVLWTPKPKFPGSFFLIGKNYHVGDINLYYINIRDNLRQRVAHYRSLHP